MRWTPAAGLFVVVVWTALRLGRVVPAVGGVSPFALLASAWALLLAVELARGAAWPRPDLALVAGMTLLALRGGWVDCVILALITFAVQSARGASATRAALALVGVVLSAQAVSFMMTTPPSAAVRDHRFGGLVGDPNEAAQRLVIVALSLLALWRTASSRVRGSVVALGALVVQALVATASRVGLVALLVLSLVVVVPIVRARRWVAVGGVLVATGVLAAMTPELVWHRLAALVLGDDGGHRWELVGRTWDLVRAHPLFGVGHGGFRLATGALPEFRYAPHSLVLETAAELGLFGLSVLAALVWGLWRRLASPEARAQPMAWAGLVTVVLGCLGPLEGRWLAVCVGVAASEASRQRVHDGASAPRVSPR